MHLEKQSLGNRFSYHYQGAGFVHVVMVIGLTRKAAALKAKHFFLSISCPVFRHGHFDFKGQRHTNQTAGVSKFKHVTAFLDVTP